MTAKQLFVLARAVQVSTSGLRGTALNYEKQLGTLRQVNWLLDRKLCYLRRGRLIANESGRRVYKHQTIS